MVNIIIRLKLFRNFSDNLVLFFAKPCAVEQKNNKYSIIKYIKTYGGNENHRNLKKKRVL